MTIKLNIDHVEVWVKGSTVHIDEHVLFNVYVDKHHDAVNRLQAATSNRQRKIAAKDAARYEMLLTLTSPVDARGRGFLAHTLTYIKAKHYIECLDEWVEDTAEDAPSRAR